METEMELVKKEAGTKVTGTGSIKYDKNGRALMPVMQNGEIKMETQDSLKKILEMKDKKEQTKKVSKSSRAKAKQTAKVSKKKVADASFRADLVARALKSVPELVKVEADDKVLLKYKNRLVTRLMVRSYGACAYCKTSDGQRDTKNIKTEQDCNDLIVWAKERVAYLKSIEKPPKESKPKVKKVAKPKNNAKKVTVEQKLEKAEAKARTYKDANGFALGNIKVNDTVKAWAETKGYKVNCKSVKF